MAKTRRDAGGEPIPSLLNSRKYWTPNHVKKLSKPGCRARTKRTRKKNDVQEHSGKSDVVCSLANAPYGLTFGQLIRGDGDEAKKEIRRLFNSRPRRPVAALIGALPRWLKVVSVHVYRTQMRALFDLGPIPNVMNASVASKLSLSPKPNLHEDYGREWAKDDLPGLHRRCARLF